MSILDCPNKQINSAIEANIHIIDIVNIEPLYIYKINDAATQLGTCTTILKRICRKHNIERWPYRKIMAITKIIANLQKENSNIDEDIIDIIKYKKLLQNVVKNPNTQLQTVVEKKILQRMSKTFVKEKEIYKSEFASSTLRTLYSDVLKTDMTQENSNLSEKKIDQYEDNEIDQYEDNEITTLEDSAITFLSNVKTHSSNLKSNSSNVKTDSSNVKTDSPNVKTDSPNVKTDSSNVN